MMRKKTFVLFCFCFSRDTGRREEEIQVSKDFRLDAIGRG